MKYNREESIHFFKTRCGLEGAELEKAVARHEKGVADFNEMSSGCTWGNDAEWYPADQLGR